MLESFNQENFVVGHKAFLEYMLEKSAGIPFTSFNHPFLMTEEIAYKWRIYSEANEVLSRNKWKVWKPGSGQILRAVQTACNPSISGNLLEHRYGQDKGNSDSALYRVTKPEDVTSLESELYNFFNEDQINIIDFSIRFDNFANYLRSHSLGCNWVFLSYLAFLIRPQSYFPILPSRFQSLLDFYGIDSVLAGKVEWNRYSTLLELAEILKSKLVVYGHLNAIEIQSYMWVVAFLLSKGKLHNTHEYHQPDFNLELETRNRHAQERERIGLLGEQFVYTTEIQILNEAGRPDLAERVRLVSADASVSGFDVLSFGIDGSERHLEVKTTTRSSNLDGGFWLTESERLRAEEDDNWRVIRVWGIDTNPTFADLGNLIKEPNSTWKLLPQSWYVTMSHVDHS